MRHNVGVILSDILAPGSVILPLEAADSKAAISILVEALELPGSDIDRQDLMTAVLTRETAGSTGLGNGIAIPHARSPRLTVPRLAVGLTSQPINFNAADGKPVSLLFLLAVPAENPTSHLRALAALSRLACDKKLLRSLNKASTPDAFFQLVARLPV